MHAMHTDPRRIVMATMMALVLALVAAALLHAVGNLEISTGGDPAPVSTQPSTATPAPVWLKDPTASPVAELRAPTTATP